MKHLVPTHPPTHTPLAAPNQQKTTSVYWNERAKRKYYYKNEEFYTTTPIPYYYRRRKIILKKIEKLIAANKCAEICDFGCGDGEYIKHLYKPDINFYGLDASVEMINEAKTRMSTLTDNKISFEVSSEGLGINKDFDLIYSSAVWAHISNEEARKLFNNIYRHIKDEGLFIICEQTAPYYYEGHNYIRRTGTQYSDLLKEAGFEVVEAEYIDFWLHRILFEYRFVKKLCNRKSVLNSDEFRIQLKKNFGID